MEENATPAQVALAWLLAQKPWIVPIPGTWNLSHFEENVQAINVRLSPADLREIESAFAKLKVHGGRMNAMQMQVVDQTT
jgi:aryl-alcohol dehydrogenase-like predicted oxidoreductase